MDVFLDLEKKGLIDLRVFDGVGAEKFAQHAFEFADTLIKKKTDRKTQEDTLQKQHS